MTGKPIPSKKKRFENIVPASEKGKVLFQSNRVTKGKWKGFTLIQSKIFICIMDELQKAIKADMSGISWNQMALFEQDSDGLFKIGVELREVCRPDQYKFIHDNAKELATIQLNFETKDKQGNKYDNIVNLFHRFEIPKVENGIKVMNIYVHKSSAEKLIEIDRNIEGRPINFTKYLKSVGLKAKNKYTYKLYMIIASWKVKGGFKIALNELKEQLGIKEEQYKNFADFKKYVLMPVQEELKDGADCWFNCASKDFMGIKKQSGKVQFLNFKIITRPDIENNNLLMNNIINMLKMHASFQDLHIDEIRPIFSETTDYAPLIQKVVELLQYVNDKGNEIINKPAYIIKSLKNEF